MGNCFKKPANCVHASSSKFSEAEKPTSQKAVSASSEKATYISNVDTSLSNNLKSFSFNDLKIAARNFRSETLLGEGGFGCVYKGWIDPDTLAPTRLATGIAVAIKKFKPESFQGHKEWLAEVNYLGQLHHENLVKLIGYCSESDNRLLVYEFMAKGSLENHLFRRGVQPIDWATRMKVIIGVARGLAFLHSLDANVIFRDLKGSNILLDSDYNAKLSDFGLARDGPTGDDTHVSTRIVGTQGYAAPEYVATGHLTPKSDVYSFGVVLLELLTGMPVMDEEQSAYSEETLVDWAKPFLSDDRRVLRIMDTRLAAKYSRKEAYAAASLALNCLQIDPRLRPSMINVVNILEQFHKRKDAP